MLKRDRPESELGVESVIALRHTLERPSFCRQLVERLPNAGDGAASEPSENE